MPDQSGTAITTSAGSVGVFVVRALVSEPNTKERTHAVPYWEVARLPGTVERRK